MPPMRTSISTRSGLNLGMTFNPSSPLDAVVSSISGESKIRWNEYRTSSSSSINSSLLICARKIAVFGRTHSEFCLRFVI